MAVPLRRLPLNSWRRFSPSTAVPQIRPCSVRDTQTEVIFSSYPFGPELRFRNVEGIDVGGSQDTTSRSVRCSREDFRTVTRFAGKLNLD
jgi:hypothetical protein